jgi:hypothetical protein
MMAKAKMPDFTVKEATLIANLVVGRYDSLVEMYNWPHPVADPKGLKKAIDALETSAKKLRPFYTGADS